MSHRPVAFITGASRGIGRGIAIELARSGFDIAGAATRYDPENTENALGEVAQRVEEHDAAFLPVAGDVADLDSHAPMLDAVFEQFGAMDVFVCNAGVAPKQRIDILEIMPESYDRVMGVNARGAFFLAQHVAGRMVEQASEGVAAQAAGVRRIQPSLIFITSINAVMSTTTRAEYCMSKAALSMAAATFAHRLADDGIAVYEVRPGITMTDMTAPVKDAYDEVVQTDLLLQKRWALPEDIGRGVASLARGDFGFSTGMVVEVSGGMNVRRF